MSKQLRCSECGKLAACNCGAPYEYVSPGKLAAKAVKDNPELSDRAIADNLGVSDTTVLRARKSTASKEAVEKRAGKNGKTRRTKHPTETKRKGLDGRTRRLPETNGTPKINGTGFSLRAANRLRGKARDAYMSKWATNNWNKKLEEHSDLKWEHEVQDELQRIVNLEKRWTEQYGDWRQFSMTPCTYKLLSQAAEVLNGLLSELKFNKTNSNGESKHHVPH